jgi:hypothetical protein
VDNSTRLDGEQEHRRVKDVTEADGMRENGGESEKKTWKTIVLNVRTI